MKEINLWTKVHACLLVYPKLVWRNTKNLRSFQPAVCFFWNLQQSSTTWELCTKADMAHKPGRKLQSYKFSWNEVALNCFSFDLQILKLIVCCLQLPGEKIWARKLRTAEAKNIKQVTFSWHFKAFDFTNFAGGINTARFSSVFIFFIMFGTISKASRDLIYATYIRCCAKLMFCRSTQVRTLYSKDRNVHWMHPILTTFHTQNNICTSMENKGWAN